jgi:Fur family transcriptional regulator, ferric uptake regulator
MVEESASAAMLEEAGLRSTEVRRRVLSALLSAGGSLSHKELAALLPELDRVSIYRNLKHLKEAKLVHGVLGVDGVLRYIVNPDRAEGCPGGHAHFLCVDCGRMTCLLDQAMPRIKAPRGSLVRGKQLLAYGLCPSCARARKPCPPRSSSAEKRNNV